MGVCPGPACEAVRLSGDSASFHAGYWAAMEAFALRTVRAMRIIARDSRVPRPLRWIAGIGLLPIPGPVDEAVLLLVAPVFLLFYREPMSDAWKRARSDSPAAY